MNIVLAQRDDIGNILRLFDTARAFMAKNGNPNQWKPGYPAKQTILQDIENRNFYVVKQDGRICGCFAYIIGEDPTYAKIEQGAWLDASVYGTIHRIASDQTVKGVFENVLRFCSEKCPHIRVDTHADNKVMQNLMKKYGFTYCGIIYIADGTPRLAYERIKE